MVDTSKVWIIIPALNEERYIGDVITAVRAEGYSNIVVINDGSTDNTANIAKENGAIVVSHSINRGPGAATQTGLDYVTSREGGMAITLDADGQHNPADIHKLVDALKKFKSDIIIGSRFLGENSHIPTIRRIFNLVANIVTFVLSSRWVSDSQSGMKAFSERARKLLSIETNGYEFCTEIFMECKEHNLTITEVPISVTYTKESMNKGQNFATGLQTVGKLFLQALSK